MPIIVEEKIPTLWSEEGKQISFAMLMDGYFVKVSLVFPPTGQTTFFGIYRGVEGFECGQLLVLETASDEQLVSTARNMCHSKTKKFYTKDIQLVEILAKDNHAIFTLFHAIGLREFYLKDARKRVRSAKEELERCSGLNW